MTNNQLKLDKLINHCKEYIPYYKNCSTKNNFLNSITDFPVIEKELIEKNYDDFLIEAINKDELLIERTSGSTGKPFSIFKSKSDAFYSNLPLWRARKKFYQIGSQDRACYFYVCSNDNYTDNYNCIEDNKLLLSSIHLNQETIEDYYKMFTSFEPKWIYASPSVLFLYVKLLKKTGFICNEEVQYIELTGENVSDEVRLIIQSFFVHAKIANQYGTRETYAIALELPCGHMHILDDNVYLEILHNKIIVTSLNNFAMPFIRYKLEDEGKIENTDCINGNTILKLHKVRNIQYLRVGNRKINPIVFYCIVMDINKTEKNICQFQIIQKNKQLTVNLVLANNNEKNKNKVQHLFEFYMKRHSYLDNFKIIFQFLLYINVEKNGKYYYFLNEGDE